MRSTRVDMVDSSERSASGALIGRGSATVLLVLFALALAGPYVLGALGVSNAVVERRRQPVDAPEWSWSALFDEEYYAELGAHLESRLPAQSFLTHAASVVEYEAFGGSLRPIVVPGEGEWLFINDSLRLPCTRPGDPVGVVDETTRFQAALEADGARLVVVPVPDKLFVYPERLPYDTEVRSCSEARVEELHERLRAASIGWVDLLAAMQDAPERPEPYFRLQDTHWTPTGAMIAVEQIMETLRPGLFDPADVADLGTRDFQGDLSEMLAVPSQISERWLTIERPGVEVETTDLDIPGARYRRLSLATSGGPSLIGGRTVLVGDSYMAEYAAELAPYFEELIAVHWVNWGSDAVDELVAEADIVILQTTTRRVFERLDRELGRWLDERS